MNENRLLALVKLLLQQEDELSLQGSLESVARNVQSLAGSPGDASLQSSLSTERKTFDDGLAVLSASQTPAGLRLIDDIGGSPFYTASMETLVEDAISRNAMTPSVAYREISEFAARRRTYVEQLTQLAKSLEAIGATVARPQTGEAEIGFTFPRELFSNHLSEFSGELRWLTISLNVFFELVTGTVEPIRLGEISSTDPVIVVGMPVGVVVAVGATITWLLDTWKKALEIKKIYDAAKSAGIDNDTLVLFEANITRIVEAGIEKQTQRLLAQYKVQEGRVQEIANGLRIAQRTMIEKIERGFRAEITYLAADRETRPPVPTEGGVEAIDERSLQEISKQLEFPAISGEAVLQLTHQSAEATHGGAGEPEETEPPPT